MPNKKIDPTAYIADDVQLNYSKSLIIEAYAHISKGTIINAEEIHIGSHTRIKGAQITARKVVFGKGCKIDDILAGGGGARSLDSYLICGDYVQINTECRLNTGAGITFEDYSALAPRSEVLTHGFWQPALDGYSASHKPVLFKKNCWVTTRGIISPGITIGENSIVLAGSVISKDIPDNVLAGGVPAKVIREDYPKKLTIEEQKQLIRELVKKAGFNLIEDSSSISKSEKPIFLFDTNITKEKVMEKAKTMKTIIFDFHNRIITGPGNKNSEEIRNHFRRNAVFFDLMNYEHPDPFIFKYWCSIESEW